MKKRSLSILIATCIACGSTPQAIAYYPELAAALLLIVAPHVGLKRQEHQQKQLFKKLQEESSTDSYGTSCGLIHPHIIIETALHRSGFFVSKVYENKNYKWVSTGSGEDTLDTLQKPQPSLIIEHPVNVSAHSLARAGAYRGAILKTRELAYLASYTKALEHFQK